MSTKLDGATGRRRSPLAASLAILRDSGVVLAVSGLVRLLGLGKEALTADKFGVGDVVDAFALASVVIMTASRILLEPVIGSTMPAYVKARSLDDEDAAGRVMGVVGGRQISAMTLGLPLAAIAGLALLAPMAMGFPDEKLLLTRQMFVVLLPILLFRTLIYQGMTVLNAERRFLLTSAINAPIAIVTIIFLLLPGDPFGDMVLAAAMTIGVAISFVMVLVDLARLRLLPRFRLRSTEVSKKVFGEYRSLMAAQMFVALMLPIDLGMAGSLESGSVAQLSYANRIVTIPIQLIAMSMGVALLPHLSSMVHERKFSEVRTALRNYLVVVLGAALVVVVALIVFAKPLISFVLEHGAFTAEDADEVARLVQLYIAQAPGYILVIAGARLLSALANNRAFAVGAAAALVANVALNLALIAVMGLAGIALSTTLVLTAQGIFVLVLGLRSLRAIESDADVATS